MIKKLQVYETPEITVTFDPNVCIHSGVCARWIQPEVADPTEVAQTVQRCPSGALQFYRNVSRNINASTLLTRAILLNQLAVLVAGTDGRPAIAGAICGAISSAGNFHWVGVYDVLLDQMAIAGWSSGDGPAHPQFPIDQGLNAVAVRTRESVVVNDVTADARYLAAFTTTRAEMIVPIINPATRKVVGTIDVESDQADAFAEEDRLLLEDCAREIAPLWEKA